MRRSLYGAHSGHHMGYQSPLSPQSRQGIQRYTGGITRLPFLRPRLGEYGTFTFLFPHVFEHIAYLPTPEAEIFFRGGTDRLSLLVGVDRLGREYHRKMRTRIMYQ
ncbi:hypothetical protein BABINDRAFT_85476 [Babjeviella inositovora NRRL Y-12698]|uniref:Uncharacterized protein n=1 Tax=Babjeviella inositovora NRRL Y-12698 TaxID=984486 RepID=A0A1E3QLC8_9ASCO|nr:uncharacterized protein BABINDRAFT_85476 [Babjeviella inositovora NRRL Y-12698]ODQ78509.1 hypothetical protein BABINDRAFT_85476 [Babjeviella inositovora NRRL Y-12698]